MGVKSLGAAVLGRDQLFDELGDHMILFEDFSPRGAEHKLQSLARPPDLPMLFTIIKRWSG